LIAGQNGARDLKEQVRSGDGEKSIGEVIEERDEIKNVLDSDEGGYEEAVGTARDDLTDRES